jgi:YVTN family beta-propeller protein
MISIDSKPDGSNMIYVTNRDNNTVSVIATDDDYKHVKQTVKPILVGKSPIGITVNPTTNTIFVANSCSNFESVVNRSNYLPLERINFNINPPNSG